MSKSKSSLELLDLCLPWKGRLGLTYLHAPLLLFLVGLNPNPYLWVTHECIPP